jgi:hypothetical protein
VLVALVALWLERKDTKHLQISQNIKICISMHLTGWLKKENQKVYRANGKNGNDAFLRWMDDENIEGQMDIFDFIGGK